MNTAIVGIGETEYSVNSALDAKQLILRAAEIAADDAGIALNEIDGYIAPRRYSELTSYDYEFFTGAHLSFSAYTGMDAGAGTISAIEMAQMVLSTGKAKYVLVIVGANQSSEAKKSSPKIIHQMDPFKRDLEIPFGFFPQPIYFATIAQRYAALYGEVEQTLATIAVTSRMHAQLTENAQMKKDLTYNDYYSASYISKPLRLFDCCLVTDGAAAIILTTMDRAKSLKKKPITVKGIATDGLDQVSPYFFSQDKNPLQTPAIKTAPKAFQQAELTHKEIDFLQIYDSFTINVVLQLEDLGFFGNGEVREKIRNVEDIAFNGKLPINTHGGLLSQGYMFGLNHVIEAVRQLRSEANKRQVENAKHGLISGFGGWYQGTLILSNQ